MAKVDLETGFRRIVWIVALIGAAGGIAIFVTGTVTGISNSRQLNQYKSALEKINRGDPEFVALDKTNQAYVLKTFNDKVQELSRTEDWTGMIYGGLGFAIGWFLLLWILFFTIRWIVRGFVKEKDL